MPIKAYTAALYQECTGQHNNGKKAAEGVELFFTKSTIRCRIIRIVFLSEM